MIASIIKGLLRGGTLDILRFVKELKNLKHSEANKFLDINGDGKVDFQDIKALQVEEFFKVVGFILLIYIANNYEQILNTIFK